VSKRPANVDPRRLQGIPRVKWVQPGNLEDAQDAIALASAYDLIPDDWQAPIVNAWLARRPDGKWVHPRCGLAIPRQNGKSAGIEIRELFGLIVLGEAILHTAHLIKTSRTAYKRLLTFFGKKVDDPDAKYPELNALVAEIRATNGQEAIFLKDIWEVDGQIVRSVARPAGMVVRKIARGGFIEFATRTGGGGRGTTYDLLIVDEAQHLSEEDLAAIRPVISSGALGNSQIIYAGTPPNPEKISDGFGEAWTRIRKGANKSKTLAWIEYGAPDGPMPDLDDQALLYETNPALEVRHGNGNFGLSLETVNGERDELSEADYARERLGWWGNPEAKDHRGVIDMEQWRSLKVAGDELPSRGLIVVDCSPDLEWTTVAVITDGTDSKPLALVDRHEGTSWVIKLKAGDDGNVQATGRIPQLVADLDSVLEVVLTPSARIFSASMTKADIEHKVLTPTEVGHGCTVFQQMVTDAELEHVGQPTLEVAVRQAVTRFVGDTQQWDRRKRSVDISPLVAVSVGVQRWATQMAKPPPAPPPSPAGLSGLDHDDVYDDEPAGFAGWNDIPL
jgi:hypothetical protein